MKNENSKKILDQTENKIKYHANEKFIPLKAVKSFITHCSIKPTSIDEYESDLYIETLHFTEQIIMQDQEKRQKEKTKKEKRRGKNVDKTKTNIEAEESTVINPVEITINNGIEYKGLIKFGMFNSDKILQSEFVFKDKTKYIGDVIENSITGKGQYHFNNGSTYKGELLNGLRHGYGEYMNNSKDNKVKYEGTWINGLKHGKGNLYLPNFLYSGDWFKGQKHGFGICKWIDNNNYYEGDFYNNKISGNGYMIWNSINNLQKENKQLTNETEGNQTITDIYKFTYNPITTINEKYVGKWNNNMRNGIGANFWYDIKGDNKFLKNRYMGEWINNKRSGYGIFYYANGSIYEGMWKNDEKHGFGLFIDSEGREKIYIFENDKVLKQTKKFTIQQLSMDFSNKKNSNITESSPVSDRKNEKDKNTDKLNSNTSNLNLQLVSIKKSLFGSTKQVEDISSKNTGLNKKQSDVGIVITEIRESPDECNVTSNISMSTYSHKKERSSKKTTTLINKVSSKKGSLENMNKNTNNLETSKKDTIKSINPKTNKKDNKLSNLEAISEIKETNENVMGNETEISHKSMSSINKDTNKVINTNEKLTTVESVSALTKRIYNNIDENPFKYNIDISDIIEKNPLINCQIYDLLNFLMRIVSEMKNWYKTYSTQFIDDLASVSNNKDTNSNASNINLHKQFTSVKTVKDVKDKAPKKEKDKEILVENISKGEKINNEIGYLLPMVSMWKFIRDCGLIGFDFCLADFNQLFYSGIRNYITFNYYEETDSRIENYNLLFDCTLRCKSSFKNKYEKELKNLDLYDQLNTIDENGRVITNNKNKRTDTINETSFSSLNLNLNILDNNDNNKKEKDFKNNLNYIDGKFLDETLDIHYPLNYILPRQFYEAITRISYLKFESLSSQTLINSSAEYLSKQEAVNIDKINKNLNNEKSKKIDDLNQSKIQNNYNNPKFLNENLTLSDKLKLIYELYFKSNKKVKTSKKGATDSTILLNQTNQFNMNTNYNNDQGQGNNFIINSQYTTYSTTFNWLNSNIFRNFENEFEVSYKKYSNYLNRMFNVLLVKYHKKNKICNKYLDYNFVYKEIFLKVNEFNVLDKIFVTSVISQYFREKLLINDENKNTREIFEYIQQLMNQKLIFYEFVELIFLAVKSIINISLTLNNIEISEDYLLDQINNLDSKMIAQSSTFRSINIDEYHFPERVYHKQYEELIIKRKKEKEENDKIQREKESAENEKRMMDLQDEMIILIDEIEHSEEESVENSENTPLDENEN